MRIQHRPLAGALALAMLCGLSACSFPDSSTESVESEAPLTDTRDISTAELVGELGVGWNLGYSLEAVDAEKMPYYVSDCETAWGNPVTTSEMIRGIANAGFGTVRIPVAWSNMMSSAFTIDADLLLRVQEVVDYVLDAGMYAILDLRWEQPALLSDPKQYEIVSSKYCMIWKQISEHFSEYSDFLLFESMSREGQFNAIWNPDSSSYREKQEAYQMLLRFNQSFVDTVRRAGGRNATRHLLIAGYGGDLDLTCDSEYQMPKDDANRCAVAISYDRPTAFAGANGSKQATWGNESEYSALTKDMEKLSQTFVSKGVPVVITECGALTLERDGASVQAYTEAVTKEALSQGICPVLWDNGAFFNRNTLCFNAPELLARLQLLMPKRPVLETMLVSTR